MAMNKSIMAVVFLVLTATMTNAYTLVMRNGRRIEIPNEFTVTVSTLTYTVGSGIQMTYQLSGIDIAATERANGEPYGAFLARASAPVKAPAPSSQTPQSRAQRSITNRDLEGYRQARIESEIAYEKRRKELGLAKAEDRRKEFAAIQERTREQLLSMRAEDQSAEEYWRGRANSLRSEMAVTQAQIDYVRRRLDEIPSANSFGGFSTLSPFGNVFGVFPNTGFPFPNLSRVNRFRGNRRFSNVFGGNLWSNPFESYDNSYERAELVNQLNELQMRNAGLGVRWRELEDEARRAGAYPGWLRP